MINTKYGFTEYDQQQIRIQKRCTYRQIEDALRAVAFVPTIRLASITNATGHLNARRMSAGLFCPIMSMLVCLCRFSFFIFTVGLIFGVKMPMGSVFYFLHLFTARNRAFHVYAHLFDSWLSAYFSVLSPIYRAVII